jgi:enamine deaminase RidA (YjgF/YER057c/UK114 family)
VEVIDNALSAPPDEFLKYPAERSKVLGEALPTSTTVAVRRLSRPELMLEIEAVALLDS